MKDANGDKRQLTLDESVFLEIKYNFLRSLPSVDDRKYGFSVSIKDPSREVDLVNISCERGIKLLSLLDELGISYYTKSGVRCVSGKSESRGKEHIAYVYPIIPFTWTEDYIAVGRRIAEFEAKQ